MKHEIKIKYLITHIIVVLMIGGLVYGSVINVSLNQVGAVAYAADDWEDLDSGDLISAFQAYCKSRNILIEGSMPYSATAWTTATFNKICNSLGINVNDLQAQIKKRTDGNLGTRWLFTVTGVNGFNRICAELLQNNELSVGDQNVNKLVYSGKIFTDDNGNKSLVYISNSQFQNYSSDQVSSQNLKVGTPFVYDKDEIISLFNSGNTKIVCPLDNSSSYDIAFVSGTYQKSNVNGLKATNMPFYVNSGNAVIYDANTAIIYYRNSSTLYYGIYNHCDWNNSSIRDRYSLVGVYQITNKQAPDTDVDINTPDDDPIEPALPEDEPIEIGDDGDTSGGGGDNPSDPDDWEPTTPNIPDPSSPDFPSVEIPDIDIPDLPSLNFSLGDLSEKFPFSIPFDAIALLTVLDGEPQAPHIQATIPIGTYYTWEFDADFSEFDNYARIFRAFEFIGFCIGMIWLTIHFIKG